MVNVPPGTQTRVPAAALSSLLKVTPIISANEGEREVYEKVRTRTKAIERLVELTAEVVGTGPVGLAVIHAGVPDEAEALRARLEAEFDCREMNIAPLACSLAVHGGPGILGIVSSGVSS